MSDGIGPLSAALAGRYRVEREVAEGGMSTVYLAHDERHDRAVALKVLRPELSALIGAERFLAEIRTTANLRHPHILPLFDSGEAGGFLFYVMPYALDSLHGRLGREQQLPVEDAVRIAVDVADALDHAHRHGIVHRDVKPGNILLEDGRAQVADFGIALAVSEAGERFTQSGLSLGTPNYMSPEQAAGDQPIDVRSDVYSLGCVLYEMLAGHPPFAASSAQTVLAKILTADPERVTVTRRSVPPHVEAAVAKALERLPADRFSSARDFAAALGDPAFRHTATAVAGGETPIRARAARLGARSRAWRTGVGAAAVLAALLSGFLLGRASRGERIAAPTLRTRLDLADLEPRANGDVMVAPDGATFAVAAAPPNGPTAIYVRRSDELAWRALPGTEGASGLAFSPDGAALAYRDADSEAILRVSLGGGLPVTLVPEGVRVDALGWGDEGTIVFSNSEGLFRVPDTGGTPERLLESGAVLLSPRLLPGGAGVIASDLSRRIVLLEVGSDSLRTIVSDGVDPTYLETGHILYGHPPSGLYVVPFDVGRLEVTGEPTPVLDDVSVTVWAAYSLSRSGTLVYTTGRATAFGQPVDRRLVLVDAAGATAPIPVPPGRISGARFSPDGRSVAYSRIAEGTSTAHVFTYHLELGGPTQLTFEGLTNQTPVWSPEGDRIAFVSSRESDTSERIIQVRALDDRTPGPPVLEREGALVLTDWKAGVLVFTQGTGARADVWTVEPTPGAQPSAYLSTSALESNTRISPDGRWVAYVSGETETTEVYVRRFPGAVSQGRISDGGGTHPRWASEGDGVYYLKATGTAPDTIFRARVQLDPSFVYRSREVVYVGEVVDFEVDPRGDRLLILEPDRTGSDASAGERTFVVTNWLAELTRRLGAR